MPRRRTLTLSHSAVTLGLLSACLLTSVSASAHDYPTYERVQFTLDCMNRNGGTYDLIYKCSCAIDKIAEQYSIDEFVDMQTSVNASDMSGPRGGGLRDNPQVRENAKRYKKTVQTATQSCGISVR